MDSTVKAKASANQISKISREKKIGKTTYRVSSVYLGETDLKDALERLAVRKVLDEINAGANARLNNK